MLFFVTWDKIYSLYEEMDGYGGSLAGFFAGAAG